MPANAPLTPDAGVDAKVILLDIEGTTTPVAFVFETLFPYARDRVSEFLGAHREREDVQRDVALLFEEHGRDVADGNDPPAWSGEPTPWSSTGPVVAYVHWLIDRDRKSTGLKGLQGKIWVAGYEDGALKGEVYDDVPPAFSRWRARGQGIAIYSSGSVLAQKLLFGNSIAGDLTPQISGYFDTKTGPKKESPSYRKIAEALGHTPKEILFVSDVIAELEAAREAGMQTVLSIRPGNAPVEPGNFPVITSFDALLP